MGAAFVWGFLKLKPTPLLPVFLAEDLAPPPNENDMLPGVPILKHCPRSKTSKRYQKCHTHFELNELLVATLASKKQ